MARDAQPGAASLFRHRTIDAAWTATQQSQRPMFVYVTSENCVYCKKMLVETLYHPAVARELASTAEPVVVNASNNPELAKKLGIRAFPTTLVISPQNSLLYKAVGYKPAQEFATELWPVLREADSLRRVALASAGRQSEAVAPGTLSTVRRAD
jgi:protein disulfide-isomerase